MMFATFACSPITHLPIVGHEHRVRARSTMEPGTALLAFFSCVGFHLPESGAANADLACPHSVIQSIQRKEHVFFSHQTQSPQLPPLVTEIESWIARVEAPIGIEQ
jgi:hypothetical protein